jgi:hypothetical protein
LPAPTDAADEPIRNDTERFPLTRAGGELRRPAAIAEFRLPVAEPDVPDGVAPYAEVLCPRQQSAIELLLGGERPGAVAEKLGIGRTTLWRWRKYDWQFRRALAAARQAVFGEAVERLRCLVPEAVDVLQARMAEGSDLAAARLLRLARVDLYEPEREDYPVPDHTPWPDAHERYPDGMR